MNLPIDSKDRRAIRIAAALLGPITAARLLAVLYVADGHPVARIARAAGVTRPTVYAWCRVYQSGGISALVALRSRART